LLLSTMFVICLDYRLKSSTTIDFEGVDRRVIPLSKLGLVLCPLAPIVYTCFANPIDFEPFLFNQRTTSKSHNYGIISDFCLLINKRI
jgi:hypothetical protein